MSIRPEVQLFAYAAEVLIKRATGFEKPLSTKEAAELSRCVGRLEELLRLEDNLKDLD
jgi:hypothetical protein